MFDSAIGLEILYSISGYHIPYWFDSLNTSDEAVGSVNSKGPYGTGCRRPCAERLAKRTQENDHLQVGSDHGVSGLKAFPTN